MTYIIQEGWSMYWGTSRWSQIEVSYCFLMCSMGFYLDHSKLQ